MRVADNFYSTQRAPSDRFDYDKDPVSWFFQNQIKSEEEFQVRRHENHKAAKKRLEGIMAAKNKFIEFMEEKEEEEDLLSIAPSELSDLDSDVSHPIRP